MTRRRLHACAALLPLAFCLALPTAAEALQFKRVKPTIESPAIGEVGVDGTTLYLRTSERLFRSTDGQSWTALNSQPPRAPARLAVDNGRL